MYYWLTRCSGTAKFPTKYLGPYQNDKWSLTITEAKLVKVMKIWNKIIIYHGESRWTSPPVSPIPSPTAKQSLIDILTSEVLQPSEK